MTALLDFEKRLKSAYVSESESRRTALAYLFSCQCFIYSFRHVGSDLRNKRVSTSLKLASGESFKNPALYATAQVWSSATCSDKNFATTPSDKSDLGSSEEVTWERISEGKTCSPCWATMGVGSGIDLCPFESFRGVCVARWGRLGIKLIRLRRKAIHRGVPAVLVGDKKMVCRTV